MRIVLALLIGGGVLVFLGIKEMRLSGAAQAEPQTLTCEQLAKDGPGENAHVVITDFEPLILEAVTEVKENNEDHFLKIWIPLAGKKEDGTAGDMNVIFMSDQLHDVESVLTYLTADDGAKLQGMVINEVDSLGSKEKNVLKTGLAGVNLDKVWIVEHDRKPAGAGKLIIFLGGGIGLMLTGGAIGYKSLTTPNPA